MRDQTKLLIHKNRNPMKNLHSIPHNLNTIFHELNNATNVKVTLTSSSTTPNPASGEPASDILEVNGFSTPSEYYHYLMSLCTEARLAIVDDLKRLDLSEKGALLLEAFNRADLLREKVSTIILPAEITTHESTKYLFLRGFINVTLISCNKQSSPPSIDNQSLLIQLHPYACQLKKAINVLSNQLITLATTFEIQQNIFMGSPVPPPTLQKKLRIRGSIPFAAAFGRILFDDNLFDIRNKSEFCRIFSGFISTIQQDDISWQSYKNHFNCPSSEALTFWDAKLSEWRKHIRKLTILN